MSHPGARLLFEGSNGGVISLGAVAQTSVCQFGGSTSTSPEKHICRTIPIWATGPLLMYANTESNDVTQMALR